MKDYAAFLLIILFPIAVASCGGSSDSVSEDSAQTDNRSSPAPEPTPNPTPQIYTFSDDSSLTPNVGFATDDEMVIVLGSDVEGDEMPLKSMVMQKEGVGSLLVEFSANGMPSAFITSDSTIKINKYSYAEGRWFIHFSVNKDDSVTDHTVELPQSFSDYVTKLDSWMRNRSDASNQLSELNKQNQSDALKDSFASMLEIAAIGVEMGACAASFLNPGMILWACQSAVSTTIDFLRDGELTPPTNLDTQKCFFGADENGISFLDPVCLITTGLRIGADQLRGDNTDTSEMEQLADKTMEQDRFIGEDPVIEDFPTPLLTAPQLAILSPQWRESYTTGQDVQIEVAASEGVDVIDYEVRSKENGAFLISGNSGKTPSGNFEIDIAAETLEAGSYFVTVSTTRAGFSTAAYSSFTVEQTAVQYIIKQNVGIQDNDKPVYSVDGQGNHIWYAEFLEYSGCETLTIEECLDRGSELKVIDAWTLETNGDIVGDMVSRGRLALNVSGYQADPPVGPFLAGDTLDPITYRAGGRIELRRGSNGGNGWFFPGTSVNFIGKESVTASIYGKRFNCIRSNEAEIYNRCQKYNDAGPPISVFIKSDGPISFSASSDQDGIKVNIKCEGPGPNNISNSTLGTIDC